MNLTQNQQKVIDFNGGNLLVSESAGSGKTTVMLSRVLRLIDEGYSLSRILISTFTKSASEDMRAKLYKMLLAKFNETSDKRYLCELENLPTADICTMHGWCQKIIRKYFFITGDDPAFEIVDANDGDMWLADSISKAVEDELEKASEDFLGVYETYIKKRSDVGLKAIIKNIIKFAEAQEDAMVWLDNAMRCYSQPER